MPEQVQLIWGEELMSYRLSEDHPLQPIRVKLTVELIQRLGLMDGTVLVPPRPASDDEIALCHDRGYIDVIRRVSDPDERRRVSPSDIRRHGLGTSDNPIAQGMHDASAYVVGASLAAARAVHEGAVRRAFSPAGGLHHAARARASGFCVYNDVAVAVAWLRSQGHRVACVDVDVHHGDGTQSLFYGDPDVLTISMHESGRYLFPGTGFPDEVGEGAGEGASANLPLAPYTWDEPWLAGFEAVIPPLLRSFRPTVLVTQDGCDTHELDPLAHVRNSTAIWPHVGRRFRELSMELCEGRWVALGGGGYAIREVVPRAWTLLFAEIVERPELAASLIDPEPFPPTDAVQEQVWAMLSKDVHQLGQALDSPLSLR
ncbi:MAG TPA: acetoin utilization protein AcuC [Candidatus Dormibacteraeota bacterium]|jgi:acetoin utilization protein AcuC|nr:acetoin utilization protein AcuC [Candidatus Dormibacteraeota bacterium]